MLLPSHRITWLTTLIEINSSTSNAPWEVVRVPSAPSEESRDVQSREVLGTHSRRVCLRLRADYPPPAIHSLTHHISSLMLATLLYIDYVFDVDQIWLVGLKFVLLVRAAQLFSPHLFCSLLFPSSSFILSSLTLYSSPSLSSPSSSL